MTTTKKFHRLRRFTGAILFMLFIGIPFLRIRGESALRFDVPSLQLFFFGTTIWMQDFFIILITIIFLTFLTLFATTILGRIWCGWLCPQTVILDATMFVEKGWKRGYAAALTASAAGAVASAVISASLIEYFVSPYELPSLLRTGGTPAKIVTGSWIILSTLIFLDLIVLRRRFCATVCPYAKLQSVLFDDRTLVVAFDPSRAKECMQCAACVKACPVGIDIRNGSQMACIHCAECVDACAERMAVRGRPSLVKYTFGIPGERKTGLRVNPLITGIITVISFLFLVYVSVLRMPFDMTVSLNYTGAPEMRPDGSITNIYVLSLRNMSASELTLNLRATSSSGVVQFSPDTIMLPVGTSITKIPISVTLQKAANSEQRPATVTFTLGSKEVNSSITKTVYFIMPK